MRKENDHIGLVELPDEALWGSQTERARRNFSVSGLPVPDELITALAQIKLAACRVNRDLGYLDTGWAAALEESCQEVIDGRWREHFVLDALQGGAGTSTNMNVNEVLANLTNIKLGNKAGEYLPLDPLAHVNLHQSTNDVYPTAIRVAALDLLRLLEADLAALQGVLQDKEREFARIIKLGRTQLQDAVPVTLGMEFGAWAELAGRDRWRIFKARERIKTINLGGTAVGTGVGAPRRYIFKMDAELRRITGLRVSRAENLVEATQNWDAVVEVFGLIKTLAANLFKIAQDLRLLSSGPTGGLGEINLPPLQAGSTIMPGKVNPVVPESVIQAALLVMNYEHLATTACSMGQLELNPYGPLISHTLLHGIKTCSGAVKMLAGHAPGITANADICRQKLLASPSVATLLLPLIGYKRVEELVIKARNTGISVWQLCRDEQVIPEAGLEELLRPENLYKLGYDDELQQSE